MLTVFMMLMDMAGDEIGSATPAINGSWLDVHVDKGSEGS